MIAKRFSLCLAALLLVSGAAAPAAKRNIVLNLDKREVRDMTPAGLVLAFIVEIANSSSQTTSLSGYDYRVVVEGADLFAWRTTLEQPIAVERDGRTRIILPVKIAYADLFASLPALKDKLKLNCYVTGLMTFTDARKRQDNVPFAFSGDFPVFQDIQVDVRPLQVKTLTIGGTEFVFSFVCRNPNGFKIDLGNLGYRLDLDGKTTAEGTIQGDNPLEPGAEKAFSLPVMLDFFDVGKEFYAILDKPSARCLLTLRATADSSWGAINLIVTKDTPVELAK